MAEHLSDEEQLEALKRWWKRNGPGLLVALVLGLGGWFGWQYWEDRQRQMASDSSLVYMAMLDAVSTWESNPSEEAARKIASHAETLKDLDEDSHYAYYAAMVLARLSAAEEDYDNAASQLQWVLDNAGDQPLAELARLRLARLETARGRHGRALALLSGDPPPAFSTLYGELKGDILKARGDHEQARAAYRTALEELDDSQSRLRAMLELKINDTLPAGEALSEENAS